MMLVLNARPKPVHIDPKKTAVVVVDMQNAFVSAGGMFDLAGIDISGAAPAIEANKRLLGVARENGVPVIYLQMSYRPDLSDAGDPSSPNYQKELGMVLMRERPELRGRLLIDDSWDWRIVDALKPEPGDQVIRKSRYSGFCNTGLKRICVPGKSAISCSPGSPPTSASMRPRATPTCWNSGPS